MRSRVGWVLAVWSLAACGHTTPCYHPDVADWSVPGIAPADVRARLVLIGDAGSVRSGDAVLVTLSDWVGRIPDRTTVLFLGDNVYPDGLPPPDDPDRPKYEQVLIAQIETFRDSGAGDAHVVLVGHHPMSTHGPHGGFFDWRDHVFPLVTLVDWLYLPLPIVGSLYPFGAGRCSTSTKTSTGVAIASWWAPSRARYRQTATDPCSTRPATSTAYRS